VLATSKALTTKHDLSIGIRASLAHLLQTCAVRYVHTQIAMVSLSTTLATNAIVEGQGGRFCLILIGYPADALETAGLGDALGAEPVVFVHGGHTVDGDEREPLDFEEIAAAVAAYASRVDAFAVSGYFGVRNPRHEIRVRDFIREKTGLPVSCGHTLTSNLHASRRALTTAFNARIIPLINTLIKAVRAILDDFGIRAPLMVVKGDGSLVTDEVALNSPVETILSGPAASLVGAVHLTGQKHGLVADMGGTTTDIAVIRNGVVCLSHGGAQIGGWQTMVEAARVHTSGLGGDSSVTIRQQELQIGPQRHIPLSLLAVEHPDVLTILKNQQNRRRIHAHAGRFAVKGRLGASPPAYLSPLQGDILNRLEAQPLSLTDIFSWQDSTVFVRHDLQDLIDRALVDISAFTPSDAAHVLGYHDAWSKEAAQIGAELFRQTAAAFNGSNFKSPEELCSAVMRKVQASLGECLVAAALKEQEGFDPQKEGRVRDIFIRGFFSQSASARPLLDIALVLKQPIIAIGAPVQTYFPSVAQILNTTLLVPPHAAVANAVGAVAGNVVQRAHFKIIPHAGSGTYRVHSIQGIQDFDELQAALSYAEGEVARQARTQARRAGARGSISVDVRRQEKQVRTPAGDMLIEIDLVAAATGRPHRISRPA
jgi:N-methylhydantoinase A/oxoprolinase/acetone carboxylase beta subunit